VVGFKLVFYGPALIKINIQTDQFDLLQNNHHFICIGIFFNNFSKIVACAMFDWLCIKDWALSIDYMALLK